MTLLESISRLYRWLNRDARFLARWPATIESQAEDGTLSLTPDSAEVKGYGQAGVIIRHGIPGLKVKVKPGSRCLLGFDGGDATKPYASLWEEGSVEQLLFNGGTSGVARIGDLVRVNWPTPLNILAATLNGQPFVATIAITSQSIGIIDTGSEKVLAGD